MNLLITLEIVMSYILIPTILILLSKHIAEVNDLEGYNGEKEEVVRKRGNKIFMLSIAYNIFSSLIIIIIFLVDSTSVYDYPINEIFFCMALIILIISVISIWLRKINKGKISNILCIVSMIVLIVYFFETYLMNGVAIDGSFAQKVVNLSSIEYEFASFNTKFTQYEGEKTGAQVKKLLQEIVTSNNNPENKDKQISVTFLDKRGNPWKEVSIDNNVITGNITAIKINSKYKVEFENDKCTYYINKCIISQLNDNQSEHENRNN